MEPAPEADETGFSVQYRQSLIKNALAGEQLKLFFNIIYWRFYKVWSVLEEVSGDMKWSATYKHLQ